MAGSANCPEAELSASEYFTTAESETSQLVNAQFYSNIINETLGNASSPDKGTYINVSVNLFPHRWRSRCSCATL